MDAHITIKYSLYTSSGYRADSVDHLKQRSHSTKGSWIVDQLAKEYRKTAISISDHSSSIVHSLTILTNLNIPLDRPKGVSNLDLSIDRRVSVRLTYILKPNTLLIQCA